MRVDHFHGEGLLCFVDVLEEDGGDHLPAESQVDVGGLRDDGVDQDGLV